MTFEHKALPQNLDAERRVLTTAVDLGHNAKAKRLVLAVRPDLFYSPVNGIGAGIVAALAAQNDLDAVSFVESASRDAHVAGRAGAVELISGPHDGTVYTLATDLRKLADLAHRRAIIASASAAVGDAHGEETAVADIDAHLSRDRAEMLARFAPPITVTVAEAVARFDAYRANLCSEHPRLVWTGLPELDDHGGIPPEYCLVLARASIGKTAMMITWALTQCLSHKRVLIWSGEQPVELIVTKMLSQITGLSSSKVLGMDNTTAMDRDGIKFAREALHKLPLEILDKRQSVTALWSHAAGIRDRGGLDAVYLDQMDKITLPGATRQNREERLAEASRDLSAMQADLGCPVFVLAQLGVKHQKDSPAPAAWQIRDCSQAIQDADRVYLIDRPEAEPARWEQMQKARGKADGKGEYGAARKMDLAGKAVVTLEKNRNGIGSTWREIIQFDARCGRFGDGQHRKKEKPAAAPIPERDWPAEAQREPAQEPLF